MHGMRFPGHTTSRAPWAVAPRVRGGQFLGLTVAMYVIPSYLKFSHGFIPVYTGTNQDRSTRWLVGIPMTHVA